MKHECGCKLWQTKFLERSKQGFLTGWRTGRFKDHKGDTQQSNRAQYRAPEGPQSILIGHASRLSPHTLLEALL
ncbi:hypothetical protein UP06_23760 [Bradyrhizobium sp. LTSP857]|nr:hypothetical protein UP06_23760 [Bradyrhizobium sp. LTSP857]